MDRWERKYGVIKIFWANFMQTSYQGWQSRVRRVCWTVNNKYTLNVTCVLLEKKERTPVLLTRTLIYVGISVAPSFVGAEKNLFCYSTQKKD